MNVLDQTDIQAIQDLAEKFSKNDIGPEALERDGYPFADFNREIVQVASSTGLFGITLPESLGGTDQGITALCAALEIIARTDASIAAFIMAQCFAGSVIAALGPDEMAQKWAAINDDGNAATLASPIYSDPEEAPGTLIASKSGGEYLLSGELEYTACLPVSKATIAPAIIDENDNIGFFLIECGAVNVFVSDPVVSLGLRAFPAADLKLNGVILSDSDRIGGDDARSVYANVAEQFRCAVASIALGVMQGAYKTARDYAVERYQAKKQIIEHHMVRKMLSNMASSIDTGKALLEKGCEFADNGAGASDSTLISIQERITMDAVLATTDAVQVLGGYGYMHDYGQEKRMRDAAQIQALFGRSPTRVQRIINRRLAKEL